MHDTEHAKMRQLAPRVRDTSSSRRNDINRQAFTQACAFISLFGSMMSEMAM
jgi:hypothetical protein